MRVVVVTVFVLMLRCHLVAQAIVPSNGGYTRECLNPDNHHMRLAPSDLPLAKIFDGFDSFDNNNVTSNITSNTSVSISGVELTVLRGSILQQGSLPDATNCSNRAGRPSGIGTPPGGGRATDALARRQGRREGWGENDRRPGPRSRLGRRDDFPRNLSR